MFDTTSTKDVDFPTFRTRIRQALNASVRTARIASLLAVSIELTAVIVAVVNFLYVILLTSSFRTWWFDVIELPLGSAITLAGLAELVMRTNPMRMPNFTPMTRFNATFDGLAMLAALISSVGESSYPEITINSNGLLFVLINFNLSYCCAFCYPQELCYPFSTIRRHLSTFSWDVLLT